MAETDEVKKLSEVSTKLSELNRTQQVELGNVKSLTQTLVNQSKAALMAQEATASAENEARKEASRARKDTAGAQDVNVLNWEDGPKDESSGGLLDSLKEMLMMKFSMGGFSLGSLFKKGGLKALLATLGTTLFGGIKTAFASVGTGIKGLLGPTLMKFLSPMALITGLVLAVKDGISAMGKSMDWGVGKISAFLGGFFAGEADGGVMNMFKNAGKWALIGAGVGSVIPVVGTALGGLVGMVIGGILGLFGAKKLAKAFSAIGSWLSEKWTAVTGFIKDIWGKVTGWFTEQWTKIKEWLFSALSFSTDTFSEGWTSLSGFVSEKWKAVKKWFEDLLTFESEGGEKIGIGEKIIELFKKIPDKIIELFKNIVEKIKTTFLSVIGSISSFLPGVDSPEEIEEKRSELQTKLKIAQGKKVTAEDGSWLGQTQENKNKEIAEIQKELSELPKLDTGGLVTKTGPAIVHEKELMLDQQAAGIFMDAANLIASLTPPKPVDLTPSDKNLMMSAAESLMGLQLDKIDLNNTAAAGNATIVNHVQNSSVGGPSFALPMASLRTQSTNKLPTG